MPAQELIVLAVFIDGRFYVSNAFDDLAVAQAWVSQFYDEPNAEIKGARLPISSLAAFA